MHYFTQQNGERKQILDTATKDIKMRCTRTRREADTSCCILCLDGFGSFETRLPCTELLAHLPNCIRQATSSMAQPMRRFDVLILLATYLTTLSLANRLTVQRLMVGYFFFFSFFCCSHLEHRASVKRFVSLHFLNVRR
jgi:hypothetical protein